MTPPAGERPRVSGNAPAFPDQGGVCESALAESAKRQSCPSAVLPRRRRSSVECRLRLRLPSAQARVWMSLAPNLRARVFTAVLNAATTGLDLHRLVASEKELHRVGVNLNQALALAYTHGGTVDAAYIQAVVEVIESLRGGRL
jgi:hypothetical protein